MSCKTIRHKSGISEREGRKARAKADRDDISFADVRRACHRWLLKHDDGYRRAYEAMTSASTPTARFAGR